MASCGPSDIYKALLAAGFSTNQAIGAMANGIAESGLNAETSVVDSNGYKSNGIWQFNEASYPNSGSLITGNCSNDIAAQVGLLKSSVSGQALAGSSAGEVAGNFAQYFERCSQCAPGGGSYNQRVANAATVAGWVSSGKWPTSSAGLSGSGSAAAAAAAGPDCAFTLGGGQAFGVVSLPSACLLKKTTIRHVVGGGLMVAGGVVGMVGVLVLVAYTFRATGAAQAAANIAGAVPGGQPAAAALRGIAGRQRTPEPEPEPAPEQETVTVIERTPIESEIGGTRTVRRSYRQPRNQTALPSVAWRMN